MNPASTLEDVIFLFDPLKSLSEPEELQKFYLDRGADVRSHFSLMLRANDIRNNNPVKLLFTGHKGAGKSTEINKLILDLNELFFVVKVQTGQRPDVTYVDMLLKTAISLFREATDQEVIKKAPAQIAAGLWEDIALFMERRIYGDLRLPDSSSALKEFTAKINLYGVELENKFELEPDSRARIRQLTENQIAEITSKIDLVADQIRLRYGRPVLFIFEDTDRLDHAVAKELFYERAATFTKFRASAIFLLVIGLRYSDKFTGTLQNFQAYKMLPNIKLTQRDGTPYPAGAAFLKELILTRLDESLIAPDALELVIQNSGGLLRTLIALVRDGALVAASRNALQIERQDVERASNRLRSNFMLEAKDYVFLAQRHADKLLDADPETQALLEKLALLEYANDKDWCDVHPLLLPEVERRAHQLEPVLLPRQTNELQPAR